MVDTDRPAISTPDLDAFMLEAPEDTPRRFTPSEARALLRTAARGEDAASLLADASLVPHLVLALWRWARAASQAVGRLGEDELLDVALGDDTPDPWTERLVPRPMPSQRALLRQGATSALYNATADEGISLLPPQDGRAVAWCEAFASVAEDLNMSRAPRGPDVLRLLLDPETAQCVPIGRKAVYRLEELLMDQAQRVLFRHGERGVMDHFRERYGLSRRECLGLVRLARADAVTYGRSSVEDDRALMVAQLKDFADRSREALNMGDEIRALRELARVQGLTRTEPEDKMSEFLGVVRRVSGRQDALHLVAAAADAVGAEPEDVSEGLEADLPTDAEFQVKERNVLDEFDLEDARARTAEEVG